LCRGRGIVGFGLSAQLQKVFSPSLALLKGVEELIGDTDVELIPLSRVATSEWADMAVARRQQQQNYTTIVRRTRGPSMGKRESRTHL
jgi:hypothetical protein